MIDLTARTRLVVCGACHDLSGPTVAGAVFRGTDRYVECLCEGTIAWTADHHQPSREVGAPNWENGGYAQGLPFLCKTCAAVILDDWCRWTVFHCTDCKPAVVALNTQAQRVVVPFGKHSIVNDSSVKSRPLPRYQDLPGAALIAAFEVIRGGRASLDRWVRDRTVENLGAVGLPTDRDVPLRQYLRAVRKSGLNGPTVLSRVLDHLLIDWLPS